MALGKLADFSSSLCTWRMTRSCVRGTFTRQALPITWDFGEMNPFAGSAGDWDEACRYLGLLADEVNRAAISQGQVQLASATDHPLPDGIASALVTDPPYYDAVPYADLSNYFYVWHKRALKRFQLDVLGTPLSPKEDEAIMDPASCDRDGRPKDASFYEGSMRRAMENGCRILDRGGIAIVVFAHKSTSGWEAVLQSVVDAGWVVTGSWPVDTERPGRLRSQDSAALASSVHLVSRPRGRAETGEWRDVLDELPIRIREWMQRLDAEGVSGADAIFACLGPALEIFSRYSRVERADGTPVTLREFLEQVWAAVAREALGLVFEGGDASGLEADARLTAMWLWTLRAGKPTAEDTGDSEEEDEGEEDEAPTAKPAKGGFSLEFDAARKIAQGLGANMEAMRSVVEVKGHTARLLPVAERARHLFDGTPAGPIAGGPAGAASPAAKPGAGKKGRKPAKGQIGFGETDEGAFTAQPGAAAGPGRSPADDLASDLATTPGATTLDRVHQAMLLFGRGRSEALARFLKEDGAGADPRFWRLAQSLSALYPTGTDEKRWVDGVLARKKGLGF
jgi:hypothetical protein